MHLLNRKLNGIDLPTSLPQDLIPPSARELDDLTTMMKSRVINDINAKPYKSQTLSFPRSSSSENISDPLGGLRGSNSSLHEVEINTSSILTKSNNARVHELNADIEILENEILNYQKDSRNYESLLDSISRENNEFIKDIEIINQRIQENEYSDQSKSNRNNQHTSQYAEISNKSMGSDTLSQIKTPVPPIPMKKAPPPPIKERKPTTTITIQPFTPPPQTNETIASKASAMLAERMALLGVKNKNTTPELQLDSAPKLLPYSKYRIGSNNSTLNEFTSNQLNNRALPPIVPKPKSAINGNTLSLSANPSTIPPSPVMNNELISPRNISSNRVVIQSSTEIESNENDLRQVNLQISKSSQIESQPLNLSNNYSFYSQSNNTPKPLKPPMNQILNLLPKSSLVASQNNLPTIKKPDVNDNFVKSLPSQSLSNVRTNHQIIQPETGGKKRRPYGINSGT